MEMTFKYRKQELEVPDRQLVDDAHDLYIMFNNLPVEMQILVLKAAECSTVDEYIEKIRDFAWRAHL
jgi:hypothetical protein